MTPLQLYLLEFAGGAIAAIIIGLVGWKLERDWTVWNTETGREIMNAFKRFDTWHKSWRSYKEPRHIKIANPLDRFKDPDWMQDKKKE